jgi:hypothetical protein
MEIDGENFNILEDSGANIRIKNCILERLTDPDGDNLQIVSDNSMTVYIYNCTLVGTTSAGIDGPPAAVNCTIYCVNNANFANTNDWQDTAAYAAGHPNYCAFDDADVFTNDVDISPGGDESADHHSAFTDPDGAPPDLTIKDINSVLYHAGETQNNDSEIPPTDIIGQTRPTGDSQVSIGAFEFIPAAAGGIMPMAMMYYSYRRKKSAD